MITYQKQNKWRKKVKYYYGASQTVDEIAGVNQDNVFYSQKSFILVSVWLDKFFTFIENSSLALRWKLHQRPADGCGFPPSIMPHVPCIRKILLSAA